jgi:HTH DNA binding domain
VALRLAVARRYYSIPRETATEELAEEVGVSHQTLSEQLRRGHGNRLNHVLVDGPGTPEAPNQKPTETDQEKRTD